MIRAGLFDSNLPVNIWRFRLEASTEKYNTLRHSSHGESPHYLWYNTRNHILEFRVWGCAIERKIPADATKALEYRTEPGYYMGTTRTKSVIRYWSPDNQMR